MNWIQWTGVAVAVVVALWPQIKTLAGRLPSVAPSVERPLGPSFEAALGDLASVRLRLVRTGALDDDQKKAIDVLTLALVDGSDK